jgi:2-ketocyclohexanecarboxyl-CoA hydrolase
MAEPSKFTDVIYEVRDRAAWIIINRPKVYNAFRGQTVEELIQAFQLAANDRNISSIVLTGAGDKAFCTGGDQSAHEGQYDGRGIVGLPIEELQGLIRDVPKPVIARVNGFAIGGGNVLATLCDLTIAADTAQFGQVGPKMGSVDAGWGTAFLARHVGAAVADGDRVGEALVQRRLRQHSRRQQFRAARPEDVLRHPGIEGRRRRLQ